MRGEGEKKIEGALTPRDATVATAQHTPGPWVLEQLDVRPFCLRIKAGDEEVLYLDRWAHSSADKTLADCVAAINFSYEERKEVAAKQQEQIANARLIAAAPAMKAVCIALLSGDTQLAIDLARAAIALTQPPAKAGEANQ